MMPKPQLALLEIMGAEVMGIPCLFLLQLDTAVIMALSYPFRNATQANSLVSDISAGMAGSTGEKKGKSGEE